MRQSLTQTLLHTPLYWALLCAVAYAAAQKLLGATYWAVPMLGVVERLFTGVEVRAIEREVLTDAHTDLTRLISRLPDASPWRWALRAARSEIERDLSLPAPRSDQRSA